MSSLTTVSQLRFSGRHLWYLTVSSMEQLIGSSLAAVTGVIVPLILLTGTPHLSSIMQGVVAATSLVGIAIGGVVIGGWGDRHGYVSYFRLCPSLIIIGSATVWLLGDSGLAWLLTGLFITGFGVGGGYSLDSDYISELMPAKWRFVCIGIAKSTSSLGFILGAAACFLMIREVDSVRVWPDLMLITGTLGLVTLIMRIAWWESPAWFMAHGLPARAAVAARHFFGKDAICDPAMRRDYVPTRWSAMFRGENLPKVIFSGIPWACEGVGVYGIGVFLPMLVAALGLMPDSETGLHRICSSVEITAWINFFILPGFILGLLLMKKVWHVALLTWGFWICAAGLVLLLAAHLWGWPVWVSLAGFFIFEIFLNAGPHLMTFVIPAQIYPVADRGAGVGIASMFGKAGAVVGVIIMPVLLHAGGMTLVLVVSTVVMVAGALVSAVMGRRVMPR